MADFLNFQNCEYFLYVGFLNGDRKNGGAAGAVGCWLMIHDTRYRGMDCGRGRHLSAVCQEAKAARFTSHLEGEQLTVDPSA